MLISWGTGLHIIAITSEELSSSLIHTLLIAIEFYEEVILNCKKRCKLSPNNLPKVKGEYQVFEMLHTDFMYLDELVKNSTE